MRHSLSRLEEKAPHRGLSPAEFSTPSRTHSITHPLPHANPSSSPWGQTPQIWGQTPQIAKHPCRLCVPLMLQSPLQDANRALQSQYPPPLLLVHAAP